jgi:hypothetical protein
MPKSRQRKDHKKKAQARKKKVAQAHQMYQKMMNSAMMEQIQKLKDAQSGATENNESVQQTV